MQVFVGDSQRAPPPCLCLTCSGGGASHSTTSQAILTVPCAVDSSTVHILHNVQVENASQPEVFCFTIMFLRIRNKNCLMFYLLSLSPMWTTLNTWWMQTSHLYEPNERTHFYLWESKESKEMDRYINLHTDLVNGKMWPLEFNLYSRRSL